MSGDHAKFSPSSAHRWMHCRGSMVMEKPFRGADTGSVYADEGTAAHFLAAHCLKSVANAAQYIGQKIAVWKHAASEASGTDWLASLGSDGGSLDELDVSSFEIDEDFAAAVQVYLNDVRDRTGTTRSLMVEQRLPLSGVYGIPDQFGTGDAVIVDVLGRHMAIEDLKFGKGEQVYAKDNEQMMLYALGALELLEPAEVEVDFITMVICQPRRDHIDEHTIGIEELRAFGRLAMTRVTEITHMTEEQVAAAPDHWLSPNEKTCRWCLAARNSACSAQDRAVSKEITNSFSAIEDGVAPALNIVQPTVMSDEMIGRKMSFLPMLDNWVKALRAEGDRRVLAGGKIIGTDGLPFKVVEGKMGARSFPVSDKDKMAKVESLLFGQIGDKAYTPRKVITAPAAAKILDKKQTAEIWKLFTPFITQTRGQPSIVPGSDPRPAYTGEVNAADFSDDAATDSLAE